MGIKVIDLMAMADKEKHRTNVFNTPRFHAWMHYYTPGQKDEMHCHNADQTFVVLDGECTMSFPDGGKAVLKRGQAALITGGSFYRLENTGSGPMIMMGNRSGPAEDIQIIDYVTRKDIRRRQSA
ncbi:MAG TPA: cupin domain-containing protein [Terriglobales bacterium]|nr:cupin domain-containing protein [Terriglobales bacterium]